MRRPIGGTTPATVGGRVITRGTMVATTGTRARGGCARLAATGAVRMILLVLVVLIAGVMVLVAPTTAPGGITGAIVIVTGEGWKCSWFKVELRRLGGAGGILLLLLLLRVAAVGRLLQVRLLLLLLLLLMLLLVVMVRMLLVKPSSNRAPMMMMRMIAPTATTTTVVMMMMTTTAASFATHRRNHVSRNR